MKKENNSKSVMEVLNSQELSQIYGGRTIEIIINGKKIIIELPD